MPSISVVVPLYNKKNCISKTIQSVLNQSFGDFELIVVDDGSTDDSFGVIRTFSDDRIICIQQENAGVAVARNTGISKATSQYIAFLDADDIWNEDYLKVIWCLIQKYPDAGFYVTAYNILLPEGKVAHSFNVKGDECGLWDSYWETLKCKYDFVWTSATVIPRKLIQDAGGFRPGELIGQDLDLWSRVALINPKIAFSGKRCVSYVRGAENNARTRVKVAYPKAFLSNLEAQMVNPDRSIEELDAITSKYRKKMIAYIYTLILNGERTKARGVIRNWSNGKTVGIAIALYCASLLPRVVHKHVYAIRLKVF